MAPGDTVKAVQITLEPLENEVPVVNSINVHICSEANITTRK